ncbi:MAG: hypothetical protein N2745_01770 [Syntrophorhabdaceae bacterium]|nr:hypothetical protein [Syntrophorhabdaceae bacterium]
MIISALKETERKTKKIKGSPEGIKDFVGMQGVYNLPSVDHYGIHPEDIILLTVKEGRLHLEKIFTAIKEFDFLYNKRPTLPHLLSGILRSQDHVLNERASGEGYIETDSSDQEKDKGHELLKTFYNSKREIKKGLKEDDEITLRQSLYTFFQT